MSILFLVSLFLIVSVFLIIMSSDFTGSGFCGFIFAVASFFLIVVGSVKEVAFKDVEYEHLYKQSSFSKYAETMRISKDGTCYSWDTSGKGNYSQQNRARIKECKMNTLPSSGGDKNNIYLGEYQYRRIHPIEAERLQTLPDNYTDCLSSKIKRIECVGNGWTVDVIAHIFKGLLTN